MATATPIYSRCSQWVSGVSGRPIASAMVLVLTLVWGLAGPLFHFTDTWQLVMNRAPSIVTFLMVFIIQNTQNRQTEALQIKLDELIRTTQGAHNALLDLEELENDKPVEFRQRYAQLAEAARKRLSRSKVGHRQQLGHRTEQR